MKRSGRRKKLMAVLFEVDVRTINGHLRNIYQNGEQSGGNYPEITDSSNDGNRDVGRNLNFYNLDAIIAVGFRMNAARAA